MTITQPANSAPQVSKHNLKTLKIRRPPVDLNYGNTTALAKKKKKKQFWGLLVASKFLKLSSSFLI